MKFGDFSVSVCDHLLKKINSPLLHAGFVFRRVAREVFACLGC